MGRSWQESFLFASHGIFWGWNIDENQCAGLSMCILYPQMRFINFLLGFIFLACPKGHCWIGLHLQYRGCSHLAWQTLQRGEREGSVMTVWLWGRVRRPSCWDAVLLCVSQTSPGSLHSYWLWPSSLEGLSSTTFCQLFQFWWNRVLLVHYNKKLFFQIKKKRITCLASLFPPPSMWPHRVASAGILAAWQPQEVGLLPG